MNFPKDYKVLKQQKYQKDNFAIVPIRWEDRENIMHWRNDQIYHLRQKEALNREDQELYFNTVVKNLFSAEYPSQVLFSYLKDDTCIGYGGLVHINWVDKHAEISFLMKTEMEEEFFHFHWSNFLHLIEKVAFESLFFHKIFTYAFDIRPQLYPVLESQGFQREAILKEHCFISNQWKDVIIHSKIHRIISVRPANLKDSNIVFEWANDPDTRKNSFNSKKILWEEHDSWYLSRINTNACKYYICAVNENEAALVRFDVEGDHWIIGININPAFRGLHLAKSFLKVSLEEIKTKNEIWAYIKPDNLASIKTFERVGFKYCSLTQIHGDDAMIFKYTVL